MTEQLTASQQMATKTFHDKLTEPQLFLSSEGTDWEGPVVKAFHEPLEFEGWVDTSLLPDVALVLVTRGAMSIGQSNTGRSGKALLVRQGDLFLRPGGGSPYELYWQSLSSEPLQTLHIQLNKDLLSRTAEEVMGYDPARLTLMGRSGFQDPLLTQIGLTLWRELEAGSPAGKLYAQSAAQLLAVHLLRHYTSASRDSRELTQGLTRRQVRQIIDFVMAHLDQDLSLDVLAQQIGFSPYHFSRLLRQTTGESPHQLVLRLRIERAQHLLKETNTPLVSVAGKCGFANQSHLTRVFKQHLGLTPRAYRLDYANSATF